jgi:hypothetical protein
LVNLIASLAAIGTNLRFLSEVAVSKKSQICPDFTAGCNLQAWSFFYGDALNSGERHLHIAASTQMRVLGACKKDADSTRRGSPIALQYCVVEQSKLVCCEPTNSEDASALRRHDAGVKRRSGAESAHSIAGSAGVASLPHGSQRHARFSRVRVVASIEDTKDGASQCATSITPS